VTVPIPAPAYGSFLRRVQAVLLDAVVVVAAVVIIFIASELTRDSSSSGRLAVIALFAVLVLYEPIMVARFGGTLGHRAMNLRVVDDRTGGNPGFLRALARFVVKTLLGILSFTTMALTRRHQAVHDSLTRTTVQIHDLARARPTDFRIERSPEADEIMPSALRRIVVIVGYMAAVFVLFALASALLIPAECLSAERCTPGEEMASTILGLLWVGLSVAAIIAGWRGRLFGCRARPAATSSS
jgi:uncharacterized RDD family membrane protein YckC